MPEFTQSNSRETPEEIMVVLQHLSTRELIRLLIGKSESDSMAILTASEVAFAKTRYLVAQELKRRGAYPFI